ncbi:MAG: hypothetical protein JWM78_2250 [Verrucomicrobiaceae bacterium]|nr:hypothetical protein [Verrucomicrobiaceae bacterium]
MKTIFAVIALSASFCCNAGRPVFHELSLADLVGAADVVAIVSKAQPFVETVQDQLGCDRVQWHLTVERTLKKQRQGYPEPKSTMNVLSNVTGVRDCTFRDGRQTSGASFSASVYKPLDPAATTNQQFIVFLVVRNGVLELLTDTAFESINRKPEVESLLR